MINFENWGLVPPKYFNGTLWEVSLHGQHVGRAIRTRRFGEYFRLTMTLASLSKHKRKALFALFDATFGQEGTYFKQKEQSCLH